MADDWSDWTRCEFYGHRYVQDEADRGRHFCTDCGDEFRTDDEDVEADARLAEERERWRQETEQ